MLRPVVAEGGCSNLRNRHHIADCRAADVNDCNEAISSKSCTVGLSLKLPFTFGGH